MDHFGKTVTVQTPPELRRFTQATVLPAILVNLVHSIQFLPGGSSLALFPSPEHKVRIESKGRFNIGTHECVLQATGPPQVDIYVHYYPFEAPDADIRSVLSKFGQIKGLRYKSFPGYSNVKTGSRIVRMVVEREIPSQQSIRGYPCRVWYKGQPIRCNICREVETKMLLAEAMDTESVASDEDYPDSEVDEVDEAVSDGSNGISDYDISGEDHLLEDVDLSLEKTRSASERAKRESGVESRNAPAPAVSSSAAAAPAVLVAPAAHAVPAAPAAPASSAELYPPVCVWGA